MFVRLFRENIRIERLVVDRLHDVRFKIDRERVGKGRRFVVFIRVDPDVKNLRAIGVLRRIDGPEPLFDVGHPERTKLYLLEKFIFLNLASTTVHRLNEVRKMSSDEVSVVFEKVRLTDSDRVAELQLILNELKELARELTRPAVPHLLVVVHQRPRRKDLVREKLSLCLDLLDRIVVRLFRIARDRIGSLLRGRYRRRLFFVSLFDLTFSNECKDENEQNQNR